MKYDKIIELCQKIGIETFEGLKRFESEYCSNGEDVLIALNNYFISLGEGWCMRWFTMNY